MKKITCTLLWLVAIFNGTYAQITSASFASPFQVPANNTPTDVRVVDMDGDGKKDLVVSNYGSNSVSVHRNIYTGGAFNASSFENAVYFPTTQPYAVAVGDIDGDGKPDIVVANLNDSISILRNTSTTGIINSSSFAQEVSFAGPGDQVYDVDLSDFDGDGKLDMVFPSYGSANKVSVYRNISTPGSLAVASRYDRSISSIVFHQAHCVKVIDYNLDNKPDFVVGGQEEGWVLFKNASSPGFIDFPIMYERNVPIGVNEGVCDFGVGDMNFDGYPDVVMDFQQRYWSPNGNYMLMASNVYNVNDNAIMPQTNNQSAYLSGYTYPGYGVDVADLDLDGKPDIVKQLSTSIRVMRNIFTGVGGSITFAGNFYPNDGYGLSFVTGGTSNGNANTDITTGDLTGDGFPEIVLTSNFTNAVSILKSQIDSTRNITTGTIASSLCVGGAVSVPYTVNGHFYGTNSFTAQLSDASGSFASPVNIGTLASTFISGTINASIPGGTPVGSGYRIRVIASTPSVIGANNGVDINITNSVPTSLSISVSPSNTICQGTSVTFTATGAGGGTPTYQWKVNGSNVGTNSPTYTTTGLANGDNVTCAMTSSLSCAAPNPILSNIITMSVTTAPLAQPSSITGASTACAFTSTTYSVPAVAGATFYTWTLPGGWTGTSTTNSITCTGGATGGTISCAAGNTCTTSVARTLNVTVTFPPTPSNAGPDQTICATSVLLAANTPASGSGVWTILAGVGSFSSTSNPNATVTNPSVGVNRYIWTITTTCAVSRDTVVITRNGSPTTANAGTDQNICGTSATLAGNSPATGTGLWTVVSGSGTFANAALFNSGVTGLSNGSNVFQWTISSGSCPSTNDQVQITSNPVPTVVTNNDTTVCPGNSVTLNVTGASTYTWSPATNLNTTTGPTVISTPTATRTYTVTGTQGICSSQDIVVVTLGAASTPTISINASATNICAGQLVNFTSTPTNQGTLPTYQWKINGVNVGTNSASFSSSTLNNGDVVTCQMISNKPCASPTTANSNSIVITVNPSVTPNISISATGPTNICASQNITFTSAITNGGTTPVYQWQVNGVNVGTNASSYSSTSWNNNDVVRCILTSNASCATSTLDTSNVVTVTVSTPVTASVNISSSGTSICAGQNVSFFAAPVNGGSTPTYQWQINGVNAGTNAPVFNSTTLANGNVVTCQLFSSAGCATPNPATSNAVFMTVTNSVAPTISINASSTNICAGATVNFTASISGGGSLPTYQWQLNGNNVGTNSSAFSSSTLNNGDVVTCILTSNATCAVPATITSNSITLTVTNSGTPTVSIAATNNPACAGGTISFTATPVNAGVTPLFDWKVNGVSVGVSTPVYNATGLSNGNNVTCVVTSSNPCAFPVSATSNTIGVIIQSNVIPTINISASQNPICLGANVTFSASITNGGTSPVYQWKINGVNVGSNSPLFASSGMNNNDVVTCELSSNASCVSPATVVSNSILMTVSGSITPSITINASATNICSGTMVNFGSSVSGEGAVPTYQWLINGVNAGTNSSIFSTSTLNQGDIVTCNLVSSAGCASPSSVISNALTFTVNSGGAPSITISATNNPTCAGGTITFSSSVTNAGGSPGYDWRINGISIGVNSATYNSAALANGDAVTCVVTSSNLCPSPTTATSNAINVVILPTTTPTININVSQNPVCAGQNLSFVANITNGGTSPIYQWKVNGVNVGTNSPSFVSASINNNDVVTCELVSNANCASPTTVVSNSINMVVNNNVMPTISISANDTTICSGQTVTFNASITNGGASPIFQWKVNGINVGTNSPSYGSALLSNGDVVICELTGSNVCSTPLLVLSNSIGITVGAVHVPSINISVNNNPTCVGSNMIFSSTTANEGANPTYTWMVNGVSVGTNAATFNSSLLQNGDTVTCLLNSDDACASPNNMLSNSIVVSMSNTTPAITIMASDSDICVGQNVVFTSSIVNGGTTPLYQWQVNGSNIGGANSASYSTSGLLSNDVVTCILQSNATCASPATVSSNPIAILVSVQNPTIQISTVDSVICANEGTSFSATAGNLGTGTVYQWQMNGANAGANSVVFIPSSLNNGDVITCNVSTNNSCGVGATLSNPIVMTVHVPAQVQISANDTTPCFGDQLTLTGSGSDSYYWTVDGSTNPIYSATAISTLDYILIGTDLNGCTDTTNRVIDILPLPTVFASNDTSICPDNNVQLNAGGGVTYIWSPTAGLDNAVIPNPVATLNTSVNYTVEVTGSNGCTNTENVLVTVIPCLGMEENAVAVNIYPNPFNDYVNIVGLDELTEVKLYNALGEVIGNWMLSSENSMIETTHLRAGVYFLTFNQHNQTITQKIIKNE